MAVDKNIKRRTAIAKRQSNKNRVSTTGQTTNEDSDRQPNPGSADEDTGGRNYAKHKARKQSPYPIKKQKIRQDRFQHHDREMIFFFILAISGAAFIMLTCSLFSVVFKEGDKSGTIFDRNVESLSLLSINRTSHHSSKEGDITHLTSNKIKHHTKVQETKPTLFGRSLGNLHLPRLEDTFMEKINLRDFGGLDLEFKMIDTKGIARQIRHASVQMSSDYRDYRTVDRDDDQDSYYAYDDDYLRNPFVDLYEEDKYLDVEGNCCRRTSEHRLYFPNCNLFHEIPLLESEVTYIGAGSYRQAMRIEIPFAQEKETVVVKDIHLSNNLAYDAYEFTRMDAIVAERLTSSPRIYSIYGSCGIGIISEYFPYGHIENIAITENSDINLTDQENGPLICYNDLPGLVKLKISMQMAEALADVHGYSGGTIVHQDVKLDQFYFNANNEVILNDFNRAEFLLWDQCREKYCGYREGYGMGNWRSPEEYYDEFLTEKVDVFSLGNNMYGLLTGVMVFHDVVNNEEVQYRVRMGEKPFIDPRYKKRSVAEAKLVEIIEKCHKYNEKNRPSIFQVVDLLWQAIEEVYDTMD